jgi:uncharacterized membrane protein YraQ (UPF0718 family)/copper chaperone CopZ
MDPAVHAAHAAAPAEGGWWAAYLSQVWSVTTELAPWLLLGAAVAGLLHAVLPPGLIRRQLQGPSGVLKAVALGVPLPLCSCGVIPAGVSLKAEGASDGAAVGFMVATPQTGVDSVLVSASMLGWPFALTKVVAALTTGLAAGLLTDLVSAPAAAAPAACAPAVEDGARPGWRAGAAHAVELIQTIWGWLVVGVLASAAITLLLPPTALVWAQDNVLLAMVGALLIGAPLYVCATASVPIAAALVAAGLPTGAAMVFLMAGPATNVATIGAVWRTFGGRALAVYLGTLTVGSMAFGFAYERLFGALRVGAGAHAHAEGGPLATAAALALVALVLSFAVQDGRLALARALDRWRAHMNPTDPAAAAPPSLALPVEGMTCGGCASRLERVLRGLEGVEAVQVDLTGKSATVVGKVSRAAAVAAIEGAGFDVPGR